MHGLRAAQLSGTRSVSRSEDSGDDEINTSVKGEGRDTVVQPPYMYKCILVIDVAFRETRALSLI